MKHKITYLQVGFSVFLSLHFFRLRTVFYFLILLTGIIVCIYFGEYIPLYVEAEEDVTSAEDTSVTVMGNTGTTSNQTTRMPESSIEKQAWMSDGTKKALIVLCAFTVGLVIGYYLSGGGGGPVSVSNTPVSTPPLNSPLRIQVNWGALPLLERYSISHSLVIQSMRETDGRKQGIILDLWRSIDPYLKVE